MSDLRFRTSGILRNILTGRGHLRVRILLALTLMVAASALFWASRASVVTAPEWDGYVRGVTYNPSHVFSLSENKHIRAARINADLKILSRFTGHVRTYTVAGGMDKVPEIARRYGLTISLGIWISADREENEDEIDAALTAVRENPSVVDRVIVGNESVLRGDVTSTQLAAYIRRIRAALPARIKVTTAETWSTWMLHPELGKSVDLIMVHLLPFWEKVPVKDAIGFVERHYDMVQQEFPNKPVVIGEVGWPSEGRPRGPAEASLGNEAYFIRSFVHYAFDKGYDYYLIEAFDQPWKSGVEGSVGAYWGMYDAFGTPKFSFTGMLRAFPEWRGYMVLAALVTLILGLIVLTSMPKVRQHGYWVMGTLVVAVTSGILMVIDVIMINYVDLAELIIIIAMAPLILIAAIIILTEGVEMTTALWRMDKRRVPAVVAENARRVSIHVPCYNEPPEMMIRTLNALAALDYENFEVIVLDNNTPDPEVWAPVAEHCKKLGERFRFYHYGNIQGFKAGALNIALALTDPEAECIAVIDSDYIVSPNWLRLTLPLFHSDRIAVVQGPQDYSDSHETPFKAMAYEEYRGFFRIGMVERNEHDAIIQHGTMTIVRKSALAEVGGWADWCITEDSELGLKLFEAGYGAAYLPDSMGQGLIPDTLKAFQAQRYRWVYGAMQILKKHAGSIFLGRSKLTLAQRYQFVSGWLPWISDSLGLIVTIMALLWSWAMWVSPRYVMVPMPAFSIAAILLFAVKCGKTMLLYPVKVKSGIMGALMASIAGLSLTHTVAKAVMSGLFTSSQPFLRTPKCADQAKLSQALRGVWQETVLFVLCMLAMLSVMTTRSDDPAALVWSIMLIVQALPYAATIATAMISARSHRKPG